MILGLEIIGGHYTSFILILRSQYLGLWELLAPRITHSRTQNYGLSQSFQFLELMAPIIILSDPILRPYLVFLVFENYWGLELPCRTQNYGLSQCLQSLRIIGGQNYLVGPKTTASVSVFSVFITIGGLELPV